MAEMDDDFLLPEDEEEDEEQEKKEPSGRPWWFFAILAGGMAILTVILTLITIAIVDPGAKDDEPGELALKQDPKGSYSLLGEQDSIVIQTRNREGECFRALWNRLELVVPEAELASLEEYMAGRLDIIKDRLISVLEKRSFEDFADIEIVESDVKTQLLANLSTAMSASTDIVIQDVWFLKPTLELTPCARADSREREFNQFLLDRSL